MGKQNQPHEGGRMTQGQDYLPCACVTWCLWKWNSRSGMDKGRLARTLRADNSNNRKGDVMAEPFGYQSDEL